ncbi:MAG TPA: hypothetical protein VEM95_00010 [Thermoplasmata archaeon]|nr:hypothetical protein [Thermoplasmata archaeon]
MQTPTLPVRLVSPTFKPELLNKILDVSRPFTAEGHFLYPADKEGNHTRGFFAIEPVTSHPAFVDAIADDIAAWARREGIDVDMVFAPAQPAVRPLADAVARRLRRSVAYWEYLPSGRFGDALVEGWVPGGSKVLALNGVSLQGRCVGLRLPQFVEGLGGDVTSAAVFAKGTTDLVHRTEDRFGPHFYSTLQVDVPVYPAASCPMCAATHRPPISWKEFADGPRP